MRREPRHLHNGWRVAAPFKDVQLAAGVDQDLMILMKP